MRNCLAWLMGLMLLSCGENLATKQAREREAEITETGLPVFDGDLPLKLRKAWAGTQDTAGFYYDDKGSIHMHIQTPMARTLMIAYVQQPGGQRIEAMNDSLQIDNAAKGVYIVHFRKMNDSIPYQGPYMLEVKTNR